MKACFNFHDASFSFVPESAPDYTIYEDSARVVLYDGKLADQGEMFLKEADTQKEWMSAFTGPFCLLSYSKKEKSLLITQHMTGSGRNLYLCRKDRSLYFASSLRELKEMAAIPFYINTKAFPRYFLDGFFPGGETLIQQVSRLKTGCRMIIGAEGIREERLCFSDLADDCELSPEDQYYRDMEDSIRESLKDLSEPVSLCLSGGYDSNCILHYLRKLIPDGKLQAFSVGGATGTDETVTAARIARLYDKVDLFTAYVSPETLTHLDEITEALEGAVFERGIFLQYELAKMLSKHKVSHILLGEGADQVFREDTYTPIEFPAQHYSVYGTPYEALAGVILPKSRLMLNAFGVEGRYPYLNLQVLRLGYRTRRENRRRKEFHKARVGKLVPESVMEMISKVGGSTDLAPLFPEGFDCSAEMKKCRYYSPAYDPELVCRGWKYPADMDNMPEAVRKYYLMLKYLESFEKQFCDR